MRLVVLVCLCAVAVPAAASTPDRSSLARARKAYNEGQYDAAIGAAKNCLAVPGEANAGRLVLGRALLERYRALADARDLSEASDTLRALDPTKLSAADRAEWLVGYGQWLFFTERYGAAAELFEDAIGKSLAGGTPAHDRALDWWASALDRHARIETGSHDRIYARLFERMQAELQRDPGSVAANYWLVASARELGEFDRAWNAALAAWLRAPLAGTSGAALRTDIDRLVLTAIIPDRARAAAAAEGRDQRQAADTMVTDWERFKQESEGKTTATK
jgi:hypothetical protein